MFYTYNIVVTKVSIFLINQKNIKAKQTTEFYGIRIYTMRLLCL